MPFFFRSIYFWYLSIKKIKNVAKSNRKKNALITYTIAPFIKRKEKHPNIQESFAIAQVFDELGYCVDVIHYTNNCIIDYAKYDVVFGFGIPFENSFKCKTKIKRIYYATGAHACFQNHAEIERIKAVNAKYSATLEPKRIVPWMWSCSTLMSDALIVIGNDWTKSTYSAYTETPIFPINATALINPKVKGVVRNVEQTRKSFLWFGSAGLIHKGLDICLDFFALHPECILHICGPREDDFFDVFCTELMLPNIHFHGSIDVQSDLFIKIIAQCSFAVLPTCSEGQATSMLTAMGAGLIPITTIYSGIDVEKYGILIQSLDMNGLNAAISKSFALKIEEINNKSDAVQEVILREYSLKEFELKMKRILQLGVLN